MEMNRDFNLHGLLPRKDSERGLFLESTSNTFKNNKSLEKNMTEILDTFKSITKKESRNSVSELLNEHILIAEPTKRIKEIYSKSGMEEMILKGKQAYLSLLELKTAYQFYVYTGFKILGMKLDEKTTKEIEANDSRDSIYTQFSFLSTSMAHVDLISRSQINQISELLEDWGVDVHSGVNEAVLLDHYPHQIYCNFTKKMITPGETFYTLVFSGSGSTSQKKTNSPKTPLHFIFKKFDDPNNPSLYAKITLCILKGLHKSDDIRIISNFIKENKISEIEDLSDRLRTFLAKMIDDDFENGNFIDKFINNLVARRNVIQKTTGITSFRDDDDDNMDY